MSTALVTGANRGIGLELCRQLSARGDRVVAVCRHASPELVAVQVETIDGVDVSKEAAIARVAQALKGRSIDLLINNAGILSVESLNDMNYERIHAQFEVNTLGPLRVTMALLPNLTRGAKVAIITSRMGSIGDNGSGGYYGYRISKAAVNMVGANLAHDLKSRGIAVAILHPGMVATDMTDGHGISPRESAANLLARLDEFRIENSGKFLHANGESLPW